MVGDDRASLYLSSGVLLVLSRLTVQSSQGLEANLLSAALSRATPIGSVHLRSLGRMYHRRIFQAAILENAVNEHSLVQNNVLAFKVFVFVPRHFCRLRTDRYPSVQASAEILMSVVRAIF